MASGLKEIEPRPLTEREAGWVRDILQVNDEWRDADITRTRVVAEGPSDEGTGLVLRAPEPENPGAKSRNGPVGNLWIELDEGSVINVQLSQFEGRLRELYVLFIDPNHSRRTLPESWIEVSRYAASV
jgi:hypothetical protein